MRKVTEAAIIVAISLAAMTDLPADSWRCGSNKVVRTGDTYHQTIQACGVPDNVAWELHGNHLYKHAWWEPGYGQQQRRLEFRGGKLMAIETER